jgi:hypothetical protein
VAPAGILVFEGIPGGPNHSGLFIRDTFQDAIETTYTNFPPWSYLGYDAVFISQGNMGVMLDQPVQSLGDTSRDALIEYLQQGGNVYVEYGSFMGGLEFTNDWRLPIFMELFGIASFSTNYGAPVPITVLTGQDGSLGQSLVFPGSTQPSNWYNNSYVPDENGCIAFVNEGFGGVAVQAEGDHDQKTFLFSYALADLVDAEFPSTREHLLHRLAEFFELDISGVQDETEIPALPVLAGNVPNPFNPSTEIRFGLDTREEVEIGIFSLDGKRVRTLVDAAYPAGWHTVRWDGRDAADRAVASGVYFVRMRTGQMTETRKMALVR